MLFRNYFRGYTSQDGQKVLAWVRPAFCTRSMSPGGKAVLSCDGTAHPDVCGRLTLQAADPRRPSQVWRTFWIQSGVPAWFIACENSDVPVSYSGIKYLLSKGKV